MFFLQGKDLLLLSYHLNFVICLTSHMNSKSYNKNNRKFTQGLRSFKDILPSKVKRLINKKGQIYSETLTIGDILLVMIYLILVFLNHLKMKIKLI